MDKFIIIGGKKLQGEVEVSGAKNVALKAIVAACLTEEIVQIENIPLISDLFVMTEIVEELGGSVKIEDHKLTVEMKSFSKNKIALERAAETRTSAMFMAPLLARQKEAIIPNPGGCRIGYRPIDRTIDGLKKMGAEIDYKSDDGYFHMKVKNKLIGIDYTFKKPTHTGTETMILASVLAQGKTILRNSAREPEIDELIVMLNNMGAKIKKQDEKTINIEGVSKLKGVRHVIGPDRNEVVTLGIAALLTKGDITVKNINGIDLNEFINKLKISGGGVESKNNNIRFFYKGELKAIDMETTPYPGFMTDWQAPWTVLMTQARGESIVHERVYESRFGYVSELKKMGADIELFNPEVINPESFYNFNIEDDHEKNKHAAKVKGPRELHNAVVTITDLRAGATLVLAALAAKGESIIKEVYHLDRGYESFEKRLQKLGADVRRVDDE